MKRDYAALSTLRAASPFASPPRVVVVADDEDARHAVALVEKLESIGADAEVHFGAISPREHLHPDAVIIAKPSGYHFTQYHAGLERALRTAM